MGDVIPIVYSRAAGSNLEAGDPTEDGYFGGCPYCRRNDGFVVLADVGKAEDWDGTITKTKFWFYCKRHRTKWCGGSMPFSYWDIFGCNESGSFRAPAFWATICDPQIDPEILLEDKYRLSQYMSVEPFGIFELRLSAADIARGAGPGYEPMDDNAGAPPKGSQQGIHLVDDKADGGRD